MSLNERKGGKEEGNCPEKKVFLGWESKVALSRTTQTTM